MGASDPAAAKMPTVTSPTAMKIRIVPSPMRLASLVAGVPQGVVLVTWTVQVHAAVVKPGRARRCCRTATFSGAGRRAGTGRSSEEHTSELQSLMSSSYADFCLKKKKQQYN